MSSKAGPSVPNRRRKQKKLANPPRPHSVKKISEKQQLEALDKLAMEFVRIVHRDGILSLTGLYCILKEPPEDLKAFTDLPISNLTKRGMWLSIRTTSSV
jgi:ATP-dependent RNA helicase DDX10/DBP4